MFLKQGKALCRYADVFFVELQGFGDVWVLWVMVNILRSGRSFIKAFQVDYWHIPLPNNGGLDFEQEGTRYYGEDYAQGLKRSEAIVFVGELVGNAHL